MASCLCERMTFYFSRYIINDLSTKWHDGPGFTVEYSRKNNGRRSKSNKYVKVLKVVEGG